MSPLAKLRVSTLACALFFSISTAAQPALAEVLISVNKSTQQMSVSVDGVPRLTAWTLEPHRRQRISRAHPGELERFTVGAHRDPPTRSRSRAVTARVSGVN